MNYIALFFAGALLCNSVPHLAAGLRGEPFPSPFAKPPGKGDSSPVVNVLWGFFNFVFGLALLAHHPVAVAFDADFLTFLAGAMTIGLHLAYHFGKVRRDRSAR